MFASTFRKLGRSPAYALWYLLLVIALPAVTFVVGGLIYFWQHSLLLVIAALWLVVAALTYGLFIHWPAVKAKQVSVDAVNGLPENGNTQASGALPEQLAPQRDWSNHDIDVWNFCCLSIENQLGKEPEWQALPNLALSQLTVISAHYHGDSNSASLQFTVPELLLVISVASDRYRQLVIEYVPYIDKISIAKASSLLNQKDTITSSYAWYNRVRRTLRLINPASAVIGELRELITNKVLAGASNAVQSDLKRLLLQEITQVGIDLYSGKLSTSEHELAGYRSQASQEDDHRQFDAAERLRILLIGQSGSGKSSLVNALTQSLQAEVGVLPVTNRLTVHDLKLDDATVVSLVDTPGIDGSNDVMALLLEQALEADLIIWITKATQPARAPDHDLYARLLASWTEQPSRLQAPMIMALTYIDQLSPKAVWQPPFDLAGDNPKSHSIVAATESAKMRIGFTADVLTIPLYLGGKHEHYNADTLAAQIMMLVDTSFNVQRNRRRIELNSKSPSWQSRWTQAIKLGKVMGQSVVKRL